MRIERRDVLKGVATLPLLAAPPRADSVIRVAAMMPTGAIDPLTVSDSGGALMLSQTGEFLIFDAPDGVLQPMLALDWSSNDDASVWTCHLRPGVTFHDGSRMAARDVAATFDRLCDPRTGSNALSVLAGVLSPGGAVCLDDLTVAFHLDAPSGNFPHCISSDNYNAIILPAHYAGDFERSFIGTGPFRLETYSHGSGASFVRNADWWGGPVLPSRVVFTFFADQAPQILALEDDETDVIVQLAVQGGQALLRNGVAKIIDVPSAMHRQIHMRCDRAPFSDKRVRQAIALTLDRPGLVAGLFDGRAQQGQDTPFAPIYTGVKPGRQRERNIAQARALLQSAGYPQGFEAMLVTDRFQEIPSLAVLVQNACKDIGIRLKLRIEDPAAYYGAAQPGSSDWLDSEMGITEYGHRGTPDAILNAVYSSNGRWNAAHFRNPEFDRLVATYVGATGEDVRQAAAGKIETMLLDETPVIIPYFCDYLTACGPRVGGIVVTAIAQMFLQHAYIA